MDECTDRCMDGWMDGWCGMRGIDRWWDEIYRWMAGGWRLDDWMDGRKEMVGWTGGWAERRTGGQTDTRTEGWREVGTDGWGYERYWEMKYTADNHFILTCKGTTEQFENYV